MSDEQFIKLMTKLTTISVGVWCIVGALAVSVFWLGMIAGMLR